MSIFNAIFTTLRDMSWSKVRHFCSYNVCDLADDFVGWHEF